jgi:hypothetical protein
MHLLFAATPLAMCGGSQALAGLFTTMWQNDTGAEEHLILSQVPMEMVNLVKGANIQYLQNEWDGEEVSADVQQNATPFEPRAIYHLHGMNAMGFQALPTLAKSSLMHMQTWKDTLSANAYRSMNCMGVISGRVPYL